MAFNIPSTTPFDLKNDLSNINNRWKRWVERFENFLVASNITDDGRKRAMLLHYAGEDVYDLFQTLPTPTPTDPPLTPYLQTLTILNNYFKPKTNKDFEIYNFRQAKQETNETINQYYARLLKLSKNCEFQDTDLEIKTQIVQSTNNIELRKFALKNQPT